MKLRTMVASAAFAVAALPANAADYVIDSKGQHASINFRIKHLGYSWLVGRFDKFSGTFSFDDASFTTDGSERLYSLTGFGFTFRGASFGVADLIDPKAILVGGQLVGIAAVHASDPAFVFTRGFGSALPAGFAYDDSGRDSTGTVRFEPSAANGIPTTLYTCRRRSASS